MATSLSNFFSFILRSNPLHHHHPPNSLFLVTLFKNALLSKVVQESHNSTSSLLSAELTSVICPSLVCANTISFKSACNVQVIFDENEPEEKLLNRFTREVMRAGVIQECKRRRFYENKQDEKNRKSREAASVPNKCL